MTKLIDTNVTLLESGDELGVRYSQEIPDHFIQEIKDNFVGANDRVGNFLRVCRVPAGVADRWLREGFDIFREPAPKIVARLKAEEMGNFVGTSKRI